MIFSWEDLHYKVLDVFLPKGVLISSLLFELLSSELGFSAYSSEISNSDKDYSDSCLIFRS